MIDEVRESAFEMAEELRAYAKQYRESLSHREIVGTPELLEEAAKLFKEADEYKWHDLRRYPDDLPESDYETCEVWLEGKIIDIAIWHKGVFVPWYAEYFQDCPPEWKKPVVAWKYIEPFEVKE